VTKIVNLMRLCHIFGFSKRGLVVCGVLFVTAAGLAAQQPSLRMEGSDLLGATIVAALESRADEMGSHIVADFRGSRPARDRLLAGVADLAIVVENADAVKLPEEWISVTLGYFTVLIVSKGDLPVDQLSFGNLAQIFGANSAVALTRWGDFGAAGVWGSVPVTGHVTQPGEGLSQILFAHLVLSDGRFKTSVIKHPRTAETWEAIKEDDGGLGIVPWMPAGANNAKVLLIAAGADQVAFGPTPQNIHAGDYPLRVPLKLIFARSRAPELLDWLRFWYSDGMEEILTQVGVVALPVSARNQQVFELEVIH
jgi:ABC-type phosphate transport system substrate-binding protein